MYQTLISFDARTEVGRWRLTAKKKKSLRLVLDWDSKVGTWHVRKAWEKDFKWTQ